MSIPSTPPTPPLQNPPPQISRNVVALGWVSLFTDIAGEMLYPLIPLFLIGTLGATPAILGLIDGIAEGGGSILRWFAGAMSDRFRRRKPFVTAGYSLSAISKPLMGLAAYAGGWGMVLAGRASDRLGKSIRTSARDALIADSTADNARGAAFGFHRAMDSIGAVAGPLAALAILAVWPHVPLQWLFFAAILPGAISAFVAAAFVRDIPHPPAAGQVPRLWQSYPSRFWRFIAAAGIFSLGNSSDTFLILRSREVGLSFTMVILAYAVYSAIFALAAYPLGGLSDKIGRKPLVIGGWIIYAGVYIGFAAWRSMAAPWLLLGIYGLYQAMTDGVTKAAVSDLVPKTQRAGAIGLFYTVSGVGQLAGSLLAGWLWNTHWAGLQINLGLAAGAVFAAAAIPVLAAVPMGEKS